MRGEEYVRKVFRELVAHDDARAGTGMSLLSALEMMVEVESPLKEQALVRLVVLGMENATQGLRRRRACA